MTRLVSHLSSFQEKKMSSTRVNPFEKIARKLGQTILLDPRSAQAILRHFVTQQYSVVASMFSPEKIASCLRVIEKFDRKSFASTANDSSLVGSLRRMQHRVPGDIGNDLSLIDSSVNDNITASSVVNLLTRDLALFSEEAAAYASQTVLSDRRAGDDDEDARQILELLPKLDEKYVSLVQSKFMSTLFDKCHRLRLKSLNHPAPVASAAALSKASSDAWVETSQLYEADIVALVSALVEGPTRFDFTRVADGVVDVTFCHLFCYAGLAVPQNVLETLGEFKKIFASISDVMAASMWRHNSSQALQASHWPARREYVQLSHMQPYYIKEYWLVSYLALLAANCAAMVTWTDFLVARLWFYQSAHIMAYALGISESIIGPLTMHAFVRPYGHFFGIADDARMDVTALSADEEQFDSYFKRTRETSERFKESLGVKSTTEIQQMVQQGIRAFFDELDSTPLVCPFVVSVKTNDVVQREFQNSSTSLFVKASPSPTRAFTVHPDETGIQFRFADALAMASENQEIVHVPGIYTRTWRTVAATLDKLAADVHVAVTVAHMQRATPM